MRERAQDPFDLFLPIPITIINHTRRAQRRLTHEDMGIMGDHTMNTVKDRRRKGEPMNDPTHMTTITILHPNPARFMQTLGRGLRNMNVLFTLNAHRQVMFRIILGTLRQATPIMRAILPTAPGLQGLHLQPQCLLPKARCRQGATNSPLLDTDHINRQLTGLPLTNRRSIMAETLLIPQDITTKRGLPHQINLLDGDPLIRTSTMEIIHRLGIGVPALRGYPTMKAVA